MNRYIARFPLFIVSCFAVVQPMWVEARAQSIKLASRTQSSAYQLRIIQNKSAIDAVAFSPNGKLLAAVGYNQIKIWDVKTWKLLRILKGGKSFGNSVVFSPDGKRVASQGLERFEAGLLTIWDIRSGKIVRSLIAANDLTGCLFSLAYSPNGNFIAGGSENSHIVLWNARTGKLKRTLISPENQGMVIRSLAFSPDSRVVAASGNNRINLWNVQTGKFLRTIHVSGDITGGQAGLSFIRKGKILMAVGGDMNEAEYVRLWDSQTGKLQRELAKHNGSISSTVVTPNGKTVISGDNSGTIRFWEIRSGKLKRYIPGQGKRKDFYGINSLSVSPDGRWLAVCDGSHSTTLMLWRLQSQ